MLYLLIFVFAVPLVWGLVLTRKESGRGVSLIIISFALIIATSGLIVYRAWRTPPPPVMPPQWNVALGETMGREVSKLAPGGGEVLVFVIPESLAQFQPAMRAARDECLRGLQNGLAGNLTVTVIGPSASVPHFNGAFLNAEALAEARQAYTNAKAIVSFLPLTVPLPESAGTSGAKLVAVVTSAESARAEIEAGRLAVAVVPRPIAADDVWKEPKGTTQQVFDARYELLTAKP